MASERMPDGFGETARDVDTCNLAAARCGTYGWSAPSVRNSRSQLSISASS